MGRSRPEGKIMDAAFQYCAPVSHCTLDPVFLLGSSRANIWAKTKGSQLDAVFALTMNIA